MTDEKKNKLDALGFTWGFFDSFNMLRGSNEDGWLEGQTKEIEKEATKKHKAEETKKHETEEAKRAYSEPEVKGLEIFKTKTDDSDETKPQGSETEVVPSEQVADSCEEVVSV